MAVTSKVLARTAASTSSTTLYTAPTTSTTAVVTNIVISNTATSQSTATVAMDGVVIVPTVAVPANSVIGFDIKQVLPANNPAKTITGYASSTAVNFHISGVEIA
jgi:hypothetical protein